MGPNEPASRGIGEGYGYVSLGVGFAGGIMVFTGAGYLLDRWFGWLPFLTIAGTLAGSVLSFVWVYQKIRADEERYRMEHPPRIPPSA